MAKITEEILIVSCTRMSQHACIGAITRSGKGLRLLTIDGSNQPLDAPYEVATIWKIDHGSIPDLIPPHVEDVRILHADYVGKTQKIRDSIARYAPVFKTPPSHLYEGKLLFSPNGAAHILRDDVPAFSTCFWETPDDLVLSVTGDHSGNNKYRYLTAGQSLSVPFVGLRQIPIPIIPKGTLVRLSLARWWKRSDDEDVRCYLQLSGWYE